MVEHERALIYWRYFYLADRGDVLAILISQKVLRQLRVLLGEFSEFGIGERLIIPALSQCRQHVPTRNFLFVDLRLLFLGLRRLLGLRLFLAIVDGSAMLLQNFQNLGAIVSPRERRWCLSTLIFMVQVDALRDQELDHVKATVLDRVIDRRVPILIDDVGL